MESLLINFLEESKTTRFNDVEIIDHSIDGSQCEVTFTHVEKVEYETVTNTKTINLWEVMAFISFCLNK